MKIFLDVDGVLLDFVSAACAVHNEDPRKVHSWDFFRNWGMTAEEFWAPIKELGEAFYTDVVEPFPWATDLLSIARRYDRKFTLATVSGEGTPEGYGGKVRAIRTLFGDVPTIVLPHGHKHLLAGQGRVLIDDSDDGTREFEEAGGLSITFPQPWNNMRLNSLEDVDGRVRVGLVESWLKHFIVKRYV